MHTMLLGNFAIHFNGDFSGVIVVDQEQPDGTVKTVAEIPFIVMLAMVGEKLKRERIAKLDDIAAEDFVYSLFGDQQP